MAASANQARSLLAHNVRRIRLARGMTQETLSHLSGVMQGHLSEIEAAKRNVSIDLMGVLAKALDIPVGELLREQRPWSPSDP